MILSSHVVIAYSENPELNSVAVLLAAVTPPPAYCKTYTELVIPADGQMILPNSALFPSDSVALLPAALSQEVLVRPRQTIRGLPITPHGVDFFFFFLRPRQTHGFGATWCPNAIYSEADSEG